MKILLFFLLSILSNIYTNDIFNNISLILINNGDSVDTKWIDINQIRNVFKVDSFQLIFNNKNYDYAYNRVTIKLYNDFYEISACFSSDFQLTNINQIFNSPFFAKSQAKFNLTNKVVRDEHCYYRFDYLDTNSHRFSLHRNFSVYSENTIQAKKSVLHDLLELLDFNYYTAIRDIQYLVTKLGNFTTNNNFLEINLVLDENSNKLSFSTIKYFVSSKSFMNKGADLVYLDFIEQISPYSLLNVMFYFNSSKQLLYGKELNHMDFDVINITEIPLTYTLSTLKNISLFHNTAKYTLNFPNKDILEEEYTCFFVHQPINEDVFVEQQETLKLIQKKRKIKAYFSSFIDQELSSDFGAQYEFYFSFCEKTENLKFDSFNEVELPIHFRYQPPLETEAYSKISLPMARISIIPYRKMKEGFNITKFYYENVLDSKYAKGINSLLREVNLYDVYLANKENLLHNIPVGNSSITTIICFITCVISSIGFLMVFLEIIFKREDSKEKMT